MTTAPTVLGIIERYYDTVPRAVATAEECGPFTIFAPTLTTSWTFYARPRLGLCTEVDADDVRRVLARQRELGLRRSLEWIDEVTPSLLPAVTDVVGDRVDRHPLLVRRPDAPAPRAASTVVLGPDHADLAAVIGAVGASFDGHDDPEPGTLAAQPGLIEDGRLIVVGAYDAEGRVVGGGTAAPRGEVAELMGIGVIPRARRTGLGGRLTQALVRAALDAGVITIFLSAASHGAASIYRRVGFDDIGTACILELGD